MGFWQMLLALAVLTSFLFGRMAASPAKVYYLEGSQVIISADGKRHPRCQLHYVWYETTDGKRGECRQ